VVLRHSTRLSTRTRLPDSHRLWRRFPAASALRSPETCRRRTPCWHRPPTPTTACRRRFGLCPVRSPLLRASRLISSPAGTEMFQFPACPSRHLCIQCEMRRLAPARVAPFGIDRIIARLQLPCHVSPLSASFLGIWPLGIHPTPFSAWLASHLISRRVPSPAPALRSRLLRSRLLRSRLPRRPRPRPAHRRTSRVAPRLPSGTTRASTQSKQLTICDCQGADHAES
jgi:hypothetical protein